MLMAKKIEVLDHGFVRLVDFMANDVYISRAARVSYDSPPREKDKGLINYMMANGHTSPFEACVFTFEIKCPFFIARQWHRHRTWSYNEVSARYTELPEEFYVPKPEHIGIQSEDNKQMRTIGELSQAEVINNVYWQQDIKKACEASFKVYKHLLNVGVPRELARGVLPMNTYTRYFGTVNLHNLFHFLKLRVHAHAQYEVQQYAHAIVSLIEPVTPLAVEAWKKTL